MQTGDDLRVVLAEQIEDAKKVLLRNKPGALLIKSREDLLQVFDLLVVEDQTFVFAVADNRVYRGPVFVDLPDACFESARARPFLSKRAGLLLRVFFVAEVLGRQQPLDDRVS